MHTSLRGGEGKEGMSYTFHASTSGVEGEREGRTTGPPLTPAREGKKRGEALVGNLIGQLIIYR